MNTRMTKNYRTDGGNRTVIGGVLEFEPGAELKGFPGADNLKPKTTTTESDIRDDLNELIKKLKNAGIMIPDDWNLSVLACPTPASMPTEQTAANSGHATVTVEGNEITITLNCKVSALADANHGETWGTHKWLGFGVKTGLDSVVGVEFTDDTGAEVTLGSGDATEATALGLSAGDFVLYIKAEDPKYLAGEKHFTLWADSYAKTKFTMKIVEPAEA
ncbi:MAG: hypothetical protein IKF39_12745 [Oscillospiraceae bacterium]|nr:hypothetical protein [Oscillospiraceae bacterium]